MRRLGIYVPHFDGQPAGLGTYIGQIGRRVVQAVPETLLFTETPDDVPGDWLPNVRIEPAALPPGPLHAVTRLPHRQLWLNTALPRALRRARCEALFVPGFGGMLRPSVPQVVVVHDLTPLVVPSPYFHPLQGVYLRGVLPRILKRASVVAVSHNTKRDVVRLLGVTPSRVRVVGEGYDRDTFRPRAAEAVQRVRAAHGLTRPYLFYSGTYAGHKNAGLLIDVLAGLAAKGLPHELALAGRFDAGAHDAVTRRAAELGLSGRVRPLGYVDRQHLPLLMQGAAAFVFPSLYEGFGLAPLEAMASGAVVLSSDRASLPEVVGDGGVLLDPTRPEAWVDALQRLHETPALQQTLRARALSRATHFDWDQAANELLTVLETAASGAISGSS